MYVCIYQYVYYLSLICLDLKLTYDNREYLAKKYDCFYLKKNFLAKDRWTVKLFSFQYSDYFTTY